MGNRLTFKYFLLTIFVIFNLLAMGTAFLNPPSLPCDFKGLLLDVPLQIREAVTMDGGQNVILTRFLHNKPLFYGANFTKCYLKYFSPLFLSSLISFLGFLFFVPGFYFLNAGKKSRQTKLLLLLLLSIPLLPIFGLTEAKIGIELFYLSLGIVSLYGLWRIHQKVSVRIPGVIKSGGFTLIEVLIVIAILSIIAASAMLVLRNVLGKGGDAARKAEISQFGQLLTTSCYFPDGGGGDYDLIPLINELFTKKPQYKSYLRRIPKDPRSGSETQSGYRYIVSQDGTKCALYANLENSSEPVTLPTLNNPTPGGGSGVLKGETNGVNGTKIYFQVSN